MPSPWVKLGLNLSESHYLITYIITCTCLLCRYLRHKRPLERDDKKGTDENGAPKKKRRGQNKHRPPTRIPFSEQLCPTLHIRAGETCHYGDKCRYEHDVKKFLENKPADIPRPCHMYSTYGLCPAGLACRFSASHVVRGENVVNKDVYRADRVAASCNVLDKSLQKNLRKRNVSFERSATFLKKLGKGIENNSSGRGKGTNNGDSSVNEGNLSSNAACNDETVTKESLPDEANVTSNETASDVQCDSSGDVSSAEGKDSEMTVRIKQDAPDHQTSGDITMPAVTPEETMSAEDRQVTCGAFTDEDTIKLRPSEIRKVCMSSA